MPTNATEGLHDEGNDGIALAQGIAIITGCVFDEKKTNETRHGHAHRQRADKRRAGRAGYG